MAKKSTLLVGLGAAVGALVLFGIGAGRSSGAAMNPAHGANPGLPPGSRVLLIGDSFAIGLRGPLAQLAAPYGIPFEGHGVVGTRIDQWADNRTVDVPGQGMVRLDLDAYLASFRPTHVLIVLGTNDERAAPEFPAMDIPKIATLLQKIRAARAEPLWVGPPSLPYPRQGISSAAKASVVRYFPSEILSIPRARDGLHPLDYGPWANAIWQWALSGHRYEAS